MEPSLSFKRKFDWGQGFARLFIVISALWMIIYVVNEEVELKTFQVEPPREITIVDSPITTSFQAASFEQFVCLVNRINSEYPNALDQFEGYRNNRVTLRGVTADQVLKLMKDKEASYSDCIEASEKKDLEARTEMRNERLLDAVIGVFWFPLFLLVFYFVTRWIVRGFAVKS